MVSNSVRSNEWLVAVDEMWRSDVNVECGSDLGSGEGFKGRCTVGRKTLVWLERVD